MRSPPLRRGVGSKGSIAESTGFGKAEIDYVTRLVLSKMDLKRVQYLAGHTDPEITLKIYTSLQKADPDALAADIWAAFDAADEAAE